MESAIFNLKSLTLLLQFVLGINDGGGDGLGRGSVGRRNRRRCERVRGPRGHSLRGRRAPPSHGRVALRQHITQLTFKIQN